MLGEQVLALVGTIAEEVNHTVGKQVLEPLFVHNYGTWRLHFAQSLVVERHIHFHAAGIDHRAIEFAFFHLDVGMEHHLAAHCFQRRNGDEGHVEAECQPFGFAHADTQTCIGTGALRHGNGIGHGTILTRILHHLFHVLAEDGGVIGALQGLARKLYLEVMANCDATCFCRRLDHQNIGHICKRG